MMNEHNILDNYRILSELYRGPSSIVYLVESRQGQKVALKEFLYDLRTELSLSEQMARIHREIMLHQQLKHPHIVGTLGEGHDRNKLVLVMEHVEGCSLQDLIKRRRLSALEVLQLIRQLCQALLYIHNLGIVHRDIKPANVMVDPHGNMKLIDFGSARQMYAPGITQTRMLVGTFGYMAPEQLYEASRVDGRSDLFSVGVMMYQMLSGQLPFAHEQTCEIINQLLHAEPTPLYRLDPGIPLSLSDLVQKLLCKDPDFRFAGAESLMKGLDALQHDPQLYYQHGQQAAEAGRVDEACEMYRRAIELDPGFTAAWQAQGHLDFASGRWAAAAACYEAVVREDTADTAILHRLGQAYFYQAQYEHALRLLQQAWSINPHDTGVALTLAQCCLAVGDADRALEHFEVLTREQPDWAVPHHELGRILYRQGHINEAFEHFLRAAILAPDDPAILFNLGSIYLEENKADKAMHWFEQVVRARPDYAEARHNLGCAFYLLGRLDQAEQELLEVIRLRPDWAQSYVLLGMIYDEKEDFAGAVAMYREALGLEPKQIKIYLYLASVYHRHWRINALVEILEQATLVAPDAASVRFQLARAYGHQGRAEDQLRELDHCLDCADIAPDMAEEAEQRVQQLRAEMKKTRRWPFSREARRAAV